MVLDLVTHTTATLAVLSTAVVYGTDVFCAVVMRPALAAVGDNTLVAVMGRVHRYGDRRMPVPGALGVVATAGSAVSALLDAHWLQAGSALVAFLALVVWLLLYARISAPVNRQMTAAAESGQVLPNGRALQEKWDSIIVGRATLQGVAVAALCLVLAS